MNQKLNTAQLQNEELKQNPINTDVQVIDSKLQEILSEIKSQDSTKEIIAALSKKLLVEQQQRLRTEEQAANMIIHEEKIITKLEEKIKILEN